MKCPHCLTTVFSDEYSKNINQDPDGTWMVYYHKCPHCKKLVIYLASGKGIYDSGGNFRTIDGDLTTVQMVRPMGSGRPPCPSEVPKDIAVDYSEACIVLPYSPKASAALSRRCLQHLLRTVGAKGRDLNAEIDAMLQSKVLPQHIADDLDTIRVTGNFAAHPSKSTSTGEIVDVEPHEAIWNLDILERLFDFFFVEPARSKAKRDAMNKKLVDAGKPPLK